MLTLQANLRVLALEYLNPPDSMEGEFLRYWFVMTLESRFGALVTLKNMQVLNVGPMGHRIGVPELE